MILMLRHLISTQIKQQMDTWQEKCEMFLNWQETRDQTHMHVIDRGLSESFSPTGCP